MRVREKPPEFHAFRIHTPDMLSDGARDYAAQHGWNFSVHQRNNGELRFIVRSASSPTITLFNEKVCDGDWVVFGYDGPRPEVYDCIGFSARFEPAHW